MKHLVLEPLCTSPRTKTTSSYLPL